MSIQEKLHKFKIQQDSIGITQIQGTARREPEEHHNRIRQTAKNEQEHTGRRCIRSIERELRVQKISLQGQEKHKDRVPFAWDCIQHKEAFNKDFRKQAWNFTF